MDYCWYPHGNCQAHYTTLEEKQKAGFADLYVLWIYAAGILQTATHAFCAIYSKFFSIPFTCYLDALYEVCVPNSNSLSVTVNLHPNLFCYLY